MKRHFLLAVTIITLSSLQPAFILAQKTPTQVESQRQVRGIEGAWEGVLELGAAKLRLVVKISKDKDGGLAATADSPDQGAMDMPVSSVTLENNALRLEMKIIGGLYEGTVNDDRSEVAGKWSQGGQSWPL